jgi:hypothetical protein
MAFTRFRRSIVVRTLALGMLAAGSAFIVGPQPVARAEEPAGKAYAVRLSHPCKVGDKYDCSASGSETTTTLSTIAGKRPLTQESTLAVTLEGAVEVLKVDGKGRPTKLACTVKKFVQTSGPEEVELLPPGAVIVADANPRPGAADGAKSRTRHTLKDQDVSAAQSKALDLVFQAYVPDSVTDDETLGTDRPQAIGATWPINREKSALAFVQFGYTTKPEDIEGHATLAGIKQLDGSDRLELDVEAICHKLDAPPPPGFKIERMTMVGKLSSLLPLDAALVSTSGSSDRIWDLAGSGTTANGEAITIHTIIQTHIEGKVTPK